VELSEVDPEGPPRNIISSVGWIHSRIVPSGICGAGWESTNFVLRHEIGDDCAVNGGDGSFGGVQSKRAGRRVSENGMTGEGLLGCSSTGHIDTSGRDKVSLLASPWFIRHSLGDEPREIGEDLRNSGGGE
jgi:hypothetical protein